MNGLLVSALETAIKIIAFFLLGTINTQVTQNLQVRVGTMKIFMKYATKRQLSPLPDTIISALQTLFTLSIKSFISVTLIKLV